jgi:hypothetical protein
LCCAGTSEILVFWNATICHLSCFLYNDQRWAGFYFARLVAFLELNVRSGEYHRDIGAQKADAP